MGCERCLDLASSDSISDSISFNSNEHGSILSRSIPKSFVRRVLLKWWSAAKAVSLPTTTEQNRKGTKLLLLFLRLLHVLESIVRNNSLLYIHQWTQILISFSACNAFLFEMFLFEDGRSVNSQFIFSPLLMLFNWKATTKSLRWWDGYLKSQKIPSVLLLSNAPKMFTNFFKVDGNGEGDKMPRKVQVAQLIIIKIYKKSHYESNRIELNRETPDFFSFYCIHGVAWVEHYCILLYLNKVNVVETISNCVVAVKQKRDATQWIWSWHETVKYQYY